MNRKVWISGDSWADFTSLLKSKMIYEDSLNGRFEASGDLVRTFAKGGSGNEAQFDFMFKYCQLVNRQNKEKLPDIWVHFWTEVGRDILPFEPEIRRVKDDGKGDRPVLEDIIENELCNMIHDLLPYFNGTKILFIGGQSPVPQKIQEEFKDYIEFVPDWKSDLLDDPLPYNQYMSMLHLDLKNERYELCKRYLPEKWFNYYSKLSKDEKKILKESENFPDDGHPGKEAFMSLWKQFKAKGVF